MPLASILGQRQRHYPKVLPVDTLIFSDAALENVSLQRSLSEVVTFNNPGHIFSDNASKNVALPRTITDTVSFSDSVNRLIALTRSISDSLTFSDSVLKNVSLSRLLSDTLTFSDSSSQNVSLGRSISDVLSFSESLLRAIALSRLLTDISSLSDNVTGTVTSAAPPPSAFDTFLLTETATVSTNLLGFLRLLPDTELVDLAANVFFPNAIRQAAVNLILGRELIPYSLWSVDQGFSIAFHKTALQEYISLKGDTLTPFILNGTPQK